MQPPQHPSADTTAHAAALRAELAALHVTEQTADGAVTVSVNAVGGVESLTFGPAADAIPREQLAGLVLLLIRRAHSAAAARQADILGPVLGEDSVAQAHVRAAVPAPPPPPAGYPSSPPPATPVRPMPPAPSAAPPPRPPDETEDGWESR